MIPFDVTDMVVHFFSLGPLELPPIASFSFHWFHTERFFEPCTKPRRRRVVGQLRQKRGPWRVSHVPVVLSEICSHSSQVHLVVACGGWVRVESLVHATIRGTRMPWDRDQASALCPSTGTQSLCHSVKVQGRRKQA